MVAANAASTARVPTDEASDRLYAASTFQSILRDP